MGIGFRGKSNVLRFACVCAWAATGAFGLAGCGPGSSEVQAPDPETGSIDAESSFVIDDSLINDAANVERVSEQTLNAPKVDAPWIRDVRVKIFPHQNRYVTPHGRESTIHRVRFESAKACDVYAIALTGDAAPKKIKTAQAFDVSASELVKASYRVLCPEPTALVRGKGLRSTRYRGEFRLYRRVNAAKRAFVEVVQHLPFEEYLKGVVPAEMPKSWEFEALKAQAVAARSYAAFQIWKDQPDTADEVRASGFDVDDTVAFQAYLGLSARSDATDEAVERTRGEILTHDGRVIKAFFSADGGGYTESSANFFGVPLKYCVSAPEPFDPALVPINPWVVYRSTQAIQARLLRFIPRPKPGYWLAKLSVPEEARFPSRRVKWVKATWKSPDSKDQIVTSIPHATFTRAQGLRSSMFDLTFLPGKGWKIVGRGYGHGVGMSQWGARTLAKLGWDYRRVLDHYYADTQLIRKTAD